MIASILVATPHTAFGELIRVSLTDIGQHQLHLVQSAKDARLCSEQNKLHLAILDAALDDEPFIPLCKSLLSQHQGLRLVIVPPDNNPNHPALGGLMPHGYLSRPFYLPDLTETVARLLADHEKQFVPPSVRERVAPPQVVPQKNSIPTWLQEPASLRERLEKEIAGNRAIAAITGVHDNESAGKMQAFAGSLSGEAAQELSDIVFRYWNHTDKTDLMRFVRLDADKKDYLVYATQITGEYILILAFDTNAPLTQVRPQTKRMAQALASNSTEKTPTAPLPAFNPAPNNNGFKQSNAGNSSDSQSSMYAEWFADEPSGAAPAEAADAPPSGGTAAQPLDDGQFFNRFHSSFPSLEDATQPMPPIDNAPSPIKTQPEAEEVAEASLPQDAELGAPDIPSDQEQEEENLEGQTINLAALLGSVPSPDPDSKDLHRSVFNSDWYQDRSAIEPIPTLPGGQYSDRSANNPFPSMANAETLPGESSPPEPVLPGNDTPPLSESPAQVEESAPPQVGSGRPASMEVKTEPPVPPPGIPAAMEPLSSLAEIPVDAVEDTHPHLVSTISSLGQLEPASPGLSLLNYTCVLVPRLPQHYLTGELADRMAAWVQQLCLAFGWRLEGISIRPEYLQWTVQVAPAISPGNLVRIVRQRISQHIFSNYPTLADQNPSGDFWANGYLIVSGSQPPSVQLLRDYISQTRKRQGVNK